MASIWQDFLDVQSLRIVPYGEWELHLENGDFKPYVPSGSLEPLRFTEQPSPQTADGTSAELISKLILSSFMAFNLATWK